MDLDTTLAELAPGLLRYCLGLAGNRPLAEESAQEALTALVARWRRHGPPESPEAFAFNVARRRLRRAPHQTAPDSSCGCASSTEDRRLRPQ